MSREPLVFLDDILDAADRIAEYLTGVDRDEFVGGPLLQDAVIRNLEVIGEAAKQLPDDMKAMIEGVEWRKMAGMRDILIHEYFGVDPDVVWDAATVKVPIMAEAVRGYRASLP